MPCQFDCIVQHKKLLMKRKNNKGNNLPGLNLFINSIIVEEKKTVYEIEKQRKKHIYYNEYINQKS